MLKVGNFGPDSTAAQPSVPLTQAAPQTMPTQTVVTNEVPVAGTCGNGSVGNGVCPISNECCSSFGFCGTSLEHCTNQGMVQ
jgi:hypothetical protein